MGQVVTRLAILGATGSIGRQALDVVRSQPDRLRVTALASARNASELELIARETGAGATVLQERDGDDALCDIATRADVDLVLVATPGIAGLAPTLAALRAGKRVALANKEVLVTGGHLVAPLAGGAGDRLRPVDSEHCGLWQCLLGERMASVSRVARHRVGRPVPRAPARGARGGDAGRGAAPPDVEDGTEGDDRLGHARQQGLRGRGDALALRTSRTSASTSSCIPRASSTRSWSSPTAA